MTDVMMIQQSGAAGKYNGAGQQASNVYGHQVVTSSSSASSSCEETESVCSENDKLNSHKEDSDLDDALADKQSGVKGDTNKSYQVLAHTFRQAVERTCGVHRLPEPSYKTAKVLSDQGVTIEQVRDSTAAMCREALQNGRTPPSTLDQVAKWAGLCNK